MDILWKYSEIIIKVHAITPTSTSGSININPWSLSRAFDKSSLFKMSAQNKQSLSGAINKSFQNECSYDNVKQQVAYVSFSTSSGGNHILLCYKPTCGSKNSEFTGTRIFSRNLDRAIILKCIASMLSSQLVLVVEVLPGGPDDGHHVHLRVLERPVVLGDLERLPLGLEGRLRVLRHPARLHRHLLLHHARLVGG